MTAMTEKHTTGGQNSPKRLADYEDQRQALELRNAGLGFEAIARQLNYASAGNAYRAATSALVRTIQPPAAEVRQLEVERLDRLIAAMWSQALGGDYAAVDRVLGIMARRAKLLGLDAPVSVDLTLRIREEAERHGLDPELAVLAA